MKVLVTGGAGYIGSTICTALIERGHTPIILDSLVTGRREFTVGKKFYHGDIADKELVKKIFEENRDIQSVIHCAALIVVSESVEYPYEYYVENVSKSIEFFKTVKECGGDNIIFSSSASVYGDTDTIEVHETATLEAKSPYARTKHMMEMVLEDYSNAYNLKAIALRYFNPLGADPKARTGSYLENPSNVIGKIMGAAGNPNEVFHITGTDYDTRDGSGIRDYIHVWDLAVAHVHAIEHIDEAFAKEGKDHGILHINVGTGEGVTVKELVHKFQQVYGQEITVKEGPRRSGDVAGAYANVTRAKELINWESKYTLEEAIAHGLRWADEKVNILEQQRAN